jgi:hypothetical protein
VSDKTPARRAFEEYLKAEYAETRFVDTEHVPAALVEIGQRCPDHLPQARLCGEFIAAQGELYGILAAELVGAVLYNHAYCGYGDDGMPSLLNDVRRATEALQAFLLWADGRARSDSRVMPPPCNF